MDLTAERLARLSPAQRALLQKRLQEKMAGGVGDRRAVTRRAPGATVPLSYAQQRLWFLDQLEPGSPFYNVPTAVRLTGRLSLDALSRTLDEIVRRHEVLRTTFAARGGGEPVQLVHPPAPVELPVTDLTSLPEAEREAEARRLATEEAQRPFDLAAGPLMRASLLRLGEEEHVALFTMHHTVCDGWSTAILVREVAALYTAYVEGKQSPLEEPPVQYADYTLWQREWLEGGVLEKQLDYWRARLGGETGALALPTDRPRPPVQTYQGAVEWRVLSEELTGRLRALAVREGATLFMVLMAGFQALLSRYAGARAVSVGTPIAGRTRPEIEDLIGLFVNTLVVRADLSGDPTFLELLGRVKEVTLGAYAHQDVPFERLVEELQPERDMSRNPLFDVMFILQNAPSEELRLPGLTLGGLKLTEGTTAKLDLLVSAVEQERGVRLALEYNTDLFDAETAARLVTHFERLLDAAASHPAQRLSELPLLTDAERRLLLVEWNGGRAPLRETTMHELFERHAALAPEEVALVYGDERLTYRELDERATLLARRLRRLGVGAESRVGVLLERSTEMFVSLLAVLKAGAAYVPVDAEHPPERAAFMLEDAGVRVLVTRGELAARLPAAERTTLDWDVWARESEEGGDEDAREALAHASPRGLAYVIYTSGSTGRPKGVMVTHRSVVNLFDAILPGLGVGGGEVWTVFHSFGFDFSVWEIWGALLTGGRLVVVPRSAALSPEALHRLLDDERVSVLSLTPSAMGQLVADPARREWLSARSAVRAVVVGGEACPPALAAALAACGRPAWNFYGPTEATVWTAVSRFEEGERVNIGRPITNTQLYILDRDLRPVPVGVPGELHIGGAGLARGYTGRPALTAERFVPDPFSTEPGARLYKTGDVTKFMPDGRIEYVERLDNQVKVRGYRIELGEIEAALARHASVREAAVVVRGEAAADKRIVAYYVAEGRAADPGELRAHLRESLPEYMTPSVYVELERLPLNPSGKIDRKALPAPDASRHAHGGAYAEPRTPAEEVLAATWAGLLKVERVGRDDNFFELGGHSLLATQAVARVREAFKVELPLLAIFKTPTIAGLAQAVESANGVGPKSITRAPRETPPPLSYAQQRLWFLDQLEPGNPFYNVPTAVRLTGRLDAAALSRTLTEFVRRHEVLRTTFASEAGEPVQLIHPPAPFELPVVDLTSLPEAEREAEARRLAAEEARVPFDLTTGPMIRASLVRLGEEDHVVLFTMHHVVCDGWSVGILVREVAALYSAYSEGRESPLEELPVQYADYAVWQRGWLQGEVLEKQLDYWRAQLGGELPALELPTDRPRSAARTHRGGRERFDLPPEVVEGLRSVSRREGATLFMVLLAGFQALLARYSSQHDVVTGTDIANRTHAETEDLVGFFVNQLVLRTDLSGDPTFRELLARVRGVTLGAYAHQDVPFERLVEELHPERDMSRSPLFQVKLVLQNTPAEILELPRLTIGTLPVETETARFDLTLSLAESHAQSAPALGGALEFSADLFDRETAARLLTHFTRLLSAAVSDPVLRLSELPLLTDSELGQLLRDGEGERTAYPRESLHRLFERQAALTPHAAAVERGRERLTYRELNRRANQLARRLLRLGAGPGSRVGLCAGRTPGTVLGLLGALKAGAAYVPLDADYPEARLLHALEDSGVSVVLSAGGEADRLPAHWAQVVEMDAEWEGIAAEDDSDLPAGGAGAESARSLCYVIYTSGSTGRPKGVMVEHAGVPNLALAQARAFGVGSGSRVLQFASPSFDASVSEVWVTLLSGATLLLPAPGEEAESGAPAGAGGAGGGALAALECGLRAGATVVTLPPALLAGLGGSAAESLAGVATLVAAGESCPASLAAEWSARVGRFLNAYGPTEATVCATVWEAGAGEGDAAGGSSSPSSSSSSSSAATAPIGRPIENVRAYVLDAWGSPVPAGVAGELYVGGAGVARGYLNAPALTAERFVPDPFSGEPGARLYRTGDVARWLASGQLEFVGRRDGQVKVRGYRVELGEVESALRGHPGVREAAVVAGDDAAGGRRLVAYVVASDAQGSNVAGLREHLRARLPEYMMPSAFVTLEALPLTPSGKVDRKALPAPEAAGAAGGGGGGGGGEPRTPVEAALAGVWRELLGAERVGRAENFFELGGHSLLATQAVSRVREALGVELPLRAVFEWPTVAGLAERVEAELRGGGGGAEAPPLRRREGAAAGGGEAARAPASYAQRRLWFLEQLEPGAGAYNVPAAVRLSGPLDVEALARTLDEVVRRHEALRTTLAEEGGEPVQLVHPPAPVEMPVTDLTHLPEAEREEEARRLAQEEARAPFDLAAGPLLRVRLLRLGEEDHVVLLTTHHVISDGWSMGVLIGEVKALYSAYVEGRESPLEELPVQYADYAAWQREWLQGEVLERQLDYWRGQLGGELPVLELPTDRPRPAAPTYRSETYSLALAEELTEGLRAIAMRAGATLFMVLLAAFDVLLARYSGQEDVVVGADVAGRTRAETEGLIGFFINILVLRARVTGRESFAELIGRVRETTLGAYAHQDVPFDKIVEELQPDRSRSKTPLFNVLFVMQNTPAGALQMPGLKVSSFGTEHSVSKFELTLFASEAGRELVFNWKYSADLFSRDAVARMAKDFEGLLRAFVEDPEAQLDDVRLESEAEDEGEGARVESSYRKLLTIKPETFRL